MMARSATRIPCAVSNSWARKSCRRCGRLARSWNSPIRSSKPLRAPNQSTEETHTMPARGQEAFVDVGGTQIRLLKSGAGAPLLILHGLEGSLGWRPYAQALADHFTVYLPSHPGFDGSQRPAWLNSIHD